MPGNSRQIPSRNALLLAFLTVLLGACATAPPADPTQQAEIDMVVANKAPQCPKMTKLICSKRTGRAQKCRCASEDDLEMLIRRF
ncbi:MAG: hypothetical protein QNJ40_20610 [Xanthomonadales bacterium]|nr:hypothetical protein [Xanthomonadales bacterium]